MTFRNVHLHNSFFQDLFFLIGHFLFVGSFARHLPIVVIDMKNNKINQLISNVLYSESSIFIPLILGTLKLLKMLLLK